MTEKRDVTALPPDEARERALDFLLPDGSRDPSGLISDEETELAQLVLGLVSQIERLKREIEKALRG